MRLVAVTFMMALAGCAPVLTEAATPEPAASTVQLAARMVLFQPLVGRWIGNGWMMLPSGERQTFSSIEVVTPRLSGGALLVEGQHRGTVDGRVVHDAMAMIVWDAHQNGYRIRTQVASGMGGDFPITPSPQGFSWRVASPAGQIDYVAEVGPDRWVERGTLVRPDGKKVPFFEMSLRRP